MSEVIERVERESYVLPAGLAQRWWMDTRELLPTMLVQTVIAEPATVPGIDAHAGIAHLDSETRGWVLQTLGGAGMDPAAWTVRVALTDWTDVPPALRAGIRKAPNAMPEPSPLFEALALVEDEQRFLQKREAARVVAAVRAWRLALDDEGRPGAANTPYQRGFLLDLGAKLKMGEGAARTLVQTASRLERDLPLVWAEFLAARVPWRQMQQIHLAADGLDPAVLPTFDAGAVAKLTEVQATSLPDSLRRLAEKLQPTTADERHDKAAATRRYTIEPGRDGMGWLHLSAPMVDLLGMDHQLTKQAIAARGKAGEVRGIATLKADILRDGMRAFLRTDAPPAGEQEALVKDRRGVEPRVTILIPALTACGRSTAAPTLQGYGPIGIKTALRIAGEAKSWIRVLTDPFTGAMLSLGRTKYRPTKDMRTFIKLLDGGSRGPGAPRGPDQSDIDHNESYWLNGEAGETSIDNLVLLSRADHVVKTAGEAEADLLLDRTLVWETRTGNKIVTRPLDPPEPTPVPPELIEDDDDGCTFYPTAYTRTRPEPPDEDLFGE